MSITQLPLVLNTPREIDVQTHLNYLKEGYVNTLSEQPKPELVITWRDTLKLLKQLDVDMPAVLEYPLIGGDRADLIFVADNRGIVVELKDWKGDLKVIDDLFVQVGNELRINPCYQVRNYVNKLNYFHSSGLQFDGYVMFYNGKEQVEGLDQCKVIQSHDELREIVRGLGDSNPSSLEKLLRGKFYVSETLVRLIERKEKDLIQNATNVLLASGFGLTESQLLLVREIKEVLDELKRGKDVDKTYLIRGSSGSGKTLVALVLLMEGLKRQVRTVLGYKNNRLLNTLRIALDEVGGAIQFYSTGYGKGVAEEKYDQDVDFLIFDEAQRMRLDNIRIAMQRGKVRVFFYDDNQMLLNLEEGTRENFLKVGKGVEERELTSVFREDESYVEWVKNLLGGNQVRFPAHTKVKFQVVEDITTMLRELKMRKEEGSKIALVCAFTESPGDEENPESCCNVRIGYPICKSCDKKVEVSDLDIYKGVDLKSVVGKDKIYWLMNAKTEYPHYWRTGGGIDRCASVYGVQGFEAEYVGVVWGRDLVWRGGQWVVNPDPITDYVGGNKSLEKTARRDKGRALQLLRNRYYVMLTRGIKGVYVFAEDEETGKLLQGLV
ncbi:DUF2075 domain-containing protein [Metallosphaera tengchongensis]|uniref:DUF2075 domain-containing protein n=1 Tax=Metallosphaera tengchongensis TaxID=1532350 RepID=A0A6N0NXB8_9CREN|nr:DNA/RNA helicase domain-containing protein [Metallosphaera tengchongensis]QKR00887.1 DUF2075 domain-containing protein [Metallosphaera tengchongensis]